MIKIPLDIGEQARIYIFKNSYRVFQPIARYRILERSSSRLARKEAGGTRTRRPLASAEPTLTTHASLKQAEIDGRYSLPSYVYSMHVANVDGKHVARPL